VTISRLRDFAAYIAIGLCFAALCIWFAERDIDKKWLSLTFETCLVFGYVIGTLRRFWRQPIFWVGTALVFVIHVVTFGLILHQLREWRAPTVGYIGVLEMAGLTTVLEKTIRKTRTRTITNTRSRNV